MCNDSNDKQREATISNGKHRKATISKDKQRQATIRNDERRQATISKDKQRPATTSNDKQLLLYHCFSLLINAYRSDASRSIAAQVTGSGFELAIAAGVLLVSLRTSGKGV
jgi:hypothetical protein